MGGGGGGEGLVLMKDSCILKVACQTEYFLNITSVGTSWLNPAKIKGLVSK